MTLAIDRRLYSPRPDTNIRVTRGVGLAVTSLSGELWIQEDTKGREQTGRKAGAKSIIFETEKVGESLQENVLGAMSELTSDSTLHVVRNNLFTMDELHSTPRIFANNEGRPIDYSLAVVVFNGDPNTMHNLVPHDTDETNPIGWMKPEEFLSREDIRPLAKHAVGYLEINRSIEETLEEFAGNTHGRELVIPPWYQVSAYHEVREQQKDPAAIPMQSSVQYTVI